MTKTIEIITKDNSAFEVARTKARYGRKTWLVYRRRDGSFATRPYTADGIKAAMLATGTNGRFWWISARQSNICQSWNYGLHLLKCARGWERHGYSAT